MQHVLEYGAPHEVRAPIRGERAALRRPPAPSPNPHTPSPSHPNPNPTPQRAAVVAALRGRVVELSRHKFASNVVEKALRFALPEDRSAVVTEVVGADGAPPGDGGVLLAMITDPFANYVVQRLLDCADEGQRARLLPHLRAHLGTVKRLTHGKHIAAAVERLLYASGGAAALRSPQGA